MSKKTINKDSKKPSLGKGPFMSRFLANKEFKAIQTSIVKAFKKVATVNESRQSKVCDIKFFCSD
jgi:hypothetical protein